MTRQTVRDDETLDELRACDLKIIQKRGGYRFSLDPLLLAEFVPLKTGAEVIDLGAGCGIIPLLLARREPSARIVGLECQDMMVDLARRNVLLNRLEQRVSIMQADVLAVRREFSVSSFDLVVANPPFRVRGTGRISPRHGRDLARHESTAGLADFLAAAKFLVRTAGSICFIHHPSRLAELLTVATDLKLAPLRLRMVHDSVTAEAGMFLVDLVKGRKGELRVLPPLFIRTATGSYGTEMTKILESDAC